MASWGARSTATWWHAHYYDNSPVQGQGLSAAGDLAAEAINPAKTQFLSTTPASAATLSGCSLSVPMSSIPFLRAVNHGCSRMKSVTRLTSGIQVRMSYLRNTCGSICSAVRAAVDRPVEECDERAL